jgi:hypothetical protein
VADVIDLTDRANLLECIAVLVDAMRRADAEFTRAHGVEPCSDEDWDTAIQAGEDVLEAAKAEY